MPAPPNPTRTLAAPVAAPRETTARSTAAARETTARSTAAARGDEAVICERCGAEMFRMHAVWRCPACRYKTDCCGW